MVYIATVLMQALFKTIYSSEIYYNFVCGNQKNLIRTYAGQLPKFWRGMNAVNKGKSVFWKTVLGAVSANSV